MKALFVVLVIVATIGLFCSKQTKYYNSKKETCDERDYNCIDLRKPTAKGKPIMEYAPGIDEPCDTTKFKCIDLLKR
jgi:hypothetical protein